MALDLEELTKRLNETMSKEREKRGGKIGASAVGDVCDAKMAFTLRGFPDAPIPNRMQRIFDTGNQLEGKIVKDLRAAGLDVMDKDPLTGKQFFYEEYGGHVWGWLDGLLVKEDGLEIVEIKTMNKAMFQSFKGKGVKVSHPHYYSQVQLLMELSGTRGCLFVAYCKDNSEYAVELVEFDPLLVGFIRSRIEGVLRGRARRIAARSDDWRCGSCSKRLGCWGGATLSRLCRYCAHAVPGDDGEWWCGLHDKKAGEACDQWEVYTPL